MKRPAATERPLFAVAVASTAVRGAPAATVSFLYVSYVCDRRGRAQTAAAMAALDATFRIHHHGNGGFSPVIYAVAAEARAIPALRAPGVVYHRIPSFGHVGPLLYTLILPSKQKMPESIESIPYYDYPGYDDRYGHRSLRLYRPSRYHYRRKRRRGDADHGRLGRFLPGAVHGTHVHSISGDIPDINRRPSILYRGRETFDPGG